MNNTLGLDGMLSELERLNPKSEFYGVDLALPLIYSKTPLEEIKLPEGFYVDEYKQSITNKFNTTSDTYETFLFEQEKEGIKKIQSQPKEEKELSLKELIILLVIAGIIFFILGGALYWIIYPNSAWIWSDEAKSAISSETIE